MALPPVNAGDSENGQQENNQSAGLSLIENITEQVEFESIDGLIDTYYERVADIKVLIPALEAKAEELALRVEDILFPDGLEEDGDETNQTIADIDIDALKAIVPDLNLLFRTYNRLFVSLGLDGDNNSYELEKKIDELEDEEGTEEESLDAIETIRAFLEKSLGEIDETSELRLNIDQIYKRICMVKGIEKHLNIIGDGFDAHNYTEPTFTVIEDRS